MVLVLKKFYLLQKWFLQKNTQKKCSKNGLHLFIRDFLLSNLNVHVYLRDLKLVLWGFLLVVIGKCQVMPFHLIGLIGKKKAV